MTKVVNIRALPADWDRNAEYVYIGRAGKGQNGPFGNPIALTVDTPDNRETVYRMYVTYLKNRVRNEPDFAEAVKGLAGKTLVCFCAPKKCHGDALAIMADHLAKR